MHTLVTHRAVICDDDALLRSVIGSVMRDVGYCVTGEAESVELGCDEIDRTAPELVVLDLALRGGNGEDLLRSVRSRHPDVQVVVFSSFTESPMRLLDAGAAAVVAKPDFERLEEVLVRLRDRHPVVSDKRRPAPRPIAPVDPPTALTLSGLEPWRSFTRALDRLIPGDAVLVFDLVPPASVVEWDDVFRVEYRTALARVAAGTRRAHDRISLSPEGIPVMALLAGHPEAPGAVFDRVEAIWRREIDTGTPVCGFGHVSSSRRGPELASAGLALLDGELDPEHALRIL